MEELIERLKDKAGITAEQAQHVLETVKDYVKEKFPMLEGAVESLFAQGKEKGEDFLDEMKDKVGGFFK
ncbi:MAG TPA: hypothetical protein VL547_23715 [Dinghuibacter sp.]|jgi:hypothetical protein|uniref:hypothetical protein n=1 Tax=Dinghuibacter sp. TaxID=2024697 RepID=UPI002CCB6782|nr:hypothetical protein [Dinghuibacter sp.]HTJ15073.1 hypothetical protein [Dinghuibacter sp.]